jgi:hypothetical protein
MTKLTMTSKCTSIAAHFEGLADALEQFTRHRPMRHVQGYLISHWTPPLGNYLLRITPAAARATCEQTTINKYTYFAGCFDGHGNALVQYRAYRPRRRSRASLEATGRRHWPSIATNSIKGTWLHRFFMFFIVNTLKKVAG